MQKNNKNLGDLYCLYLLTETQFPSCIRFSESINGEISHDKINRFLEDNRCGGKEIFEEVKKYLCLEGGTLHIDDSVTDKIYSYLGKSDLTGRYYSGKHHRVIQGIALITLFYTDINGVKLPVNYRVIDKNEGKSKNELFLEMLKELLTWGLKTSMVTGDSWYSSVENLNFLIKQGISFLFSLKENRLICKLGKKGEFQQISMVELNDSGEIVYLKGVAFVKVFKKDGNYYAYYNGKANNKKDHSNLYKLSKEDFENVKRLHWDIENYHRCIKQVCNIEGHRFRNKGTIKGHFYYSLRAFCILEVNRCLGKFKNRYTYIFESTRKIIKNALSKISIFNLVLAGI